eukprot:CAMPEP_0116578830 /NCGR_PEP_ID=MMETSP0397-20121206/21926_1 /TAXON_ID=216820 /ORGANISM="Cyclophora tenuis, Strain ECT3854" /LENGTH=306 /DNA_ID=CAMNT_0004108267 /DNA_START=276 /DNA_END=1196 /DNA_ORIENTATION=+
MASVGLVATFTLQGVFKHALTEGDRIVLLAVSEHYDQGLYAIGSSYGGMAARLLLQPLEENARLLWSHESEHEGQSSSRLEDSYVLLVKLVVYLGLLFASLAVHYTDVLLTILGQNREASPVVAVFCTYTAFLAWNGMTEAFVYGVTSSKRQVGEVGLAHTIVGICFAVVAPVAVSRHGTVGLVGANSICMVLRGLYAVSFAARYRFPGISMLDLIRQMMPPLLVLVMGFGLSFFVTRQSLRYFEHELVQLDSIGIRNPAWCKIALRHVAVGLACAVGTASLVVTNDGLFLKKLQETFSSRRLKRD